MAETEAMISLNLEPFRPESAAPFVAALLKIGLRWIKRLIKVGARVSYHARSWYVHVASASPLAHHYRAVLAWGP